MFEVNFILIKALIELLQRKISLKIYIYQRDPSCLCDTVTSSFSTLPKTEKLDLPVPSVLSMRACYNTGKWNNILVLMTL